jgi:uncharacterized Ntn-hydrolase superfamily protein
MTFSIIARCPLTRRLGPRHRDLLNRRRRPLLKASATVVGVCKTQAYINRGNDLLALELLEQGLGPSAVMHALEQNDPDHAWRQIAILDREGNAAAHTGRGTRPWSGHHVGDASWPSATFWLGRR